MDFLQEVQTIKGSFRQLQIAACYERRLWNRAEVSLQSLCAETSIPVQA
ncbi:Hypothetical protein BSSP2_II0113 [Brucella suis bv. 2]|nr:Hypothetical protein BSSP2_II0113 [Brucella suis bv. 2]